PPFRAEHVGSLIRPSALIDAREKAEKKEISDAELKRVQHAAIREVVRLQEELGLKLVTDGEYNRHSWHRDFMLKFSNVRMIPSKLTVRFHSAEGDRLHSPPTMQVTGKLARPDGGGVFVDDFKFLVSVARATPKITLPSPTVMHFRGGRGAIDTKAYPDIDAFYDDLARVYREEIRDLAAAGCRYLQIDEVNLAYLCDAELRKQVANIGEDPTTLPRTYAKLLNATIKDRPRDMTVCMHLCRGNFAGAWVADGGYDRSLSSFSTKSTWTAIFSSMTARAPAALNRCVFCPGTRRPSSVWSRPRAPSSNRRTSSSVASTRQASTPRWSSSP